ncbi:hypothetical protein R3W88_010549 [Solanum pinnatisectum]|uniref:Uncharacterized protein n=1 Tax=Solanum pinnatisectum TaxID=50273 RepID=A0AAV9MFY9_9SOLN|nr:hypothetical protein R3W88_010549 [Solanum pinnatisectum]
MGNLQEFEGFVAFTMMFVGYPKSVVKRGLDNYYAKYIQTSSVNLIYHVCFGGMIFSYPFATLYTNNTLNVDLPRYFRNSSFILIDELT